LNVDQIVSSISPQIKITAELCATLALALVVIFLSRFLIKTDLFKRGRNDACWVKGSFSDLLYGAGIGILFLCVTSLLSIKSLFNGFSQGYSAFTQMTELNKTAGFHFTVIINFLIYFTTIP
jgi:hypothetical protein